VGKLLNGALVRLDCFLCRGQISLGCLCLFACLSFGLSGRSDRLKIGGKLPFLNLLNNLIR
jgi:hypothetical protein